MNENQGMVRYFEFLATRDGDAISCAIGCRSARLSSTASNPPQCAHTRRSIRLLTSVTSPGGVRSSALNPVCLDSGDGQG